MEHKPLQPWKNKSLQKNPSAASKVPAGVQVTPVDIHQVKGTVLNIGQWVAVLSKMRQKKIFSADIPAAVEQGLKSGQLKFVKDKSGQLLAQVRDQQGRITHNLKLKEMTTDLSHNSVPMVQNMILQQQLAEIAEKLESLQRSVDSICREMHLDRLAKVNAAMQQMQMALSLEETDPLRVAFLTASSPLVLEGTEQIKAAVKERVAQLCALKEEGVVKKYFTSMSQKEVDKNIAALCQQIKDLHQSIYSAAYIYLYIGRPQLVQIVIENYRRFLEEVFPKNVRLILNSQAGNRKEIKTWNNECEQIKRQMELYLQNISRQGELSYEQ